MDDSEFVAKIGVSVITELFKAALKGVEGTQERIKTKGIEKDFFGRAAKRYSEKLEELYNFVHIFGMDRPVPLRKIYTEVNILSKLSARLRTSAEELEKNFDRD